MPKITYIEHDGSSHTVDAEIGSTVMETALRNDIASIIAECGSSSCRLRDLPGACQREVVRSGRPTFGQEEQLDAAFEVEQDLAPVLPDQGDGGARRAGGAHAGLSGAVTPPALTLIGAPTFASPFVIAGLVTSHSTSFCCARGSKALDVDALGNRGLAPTSACKTSSQLRVGKRADLGDKVRAGHDG